MLWLEWELNILFELQKSQQKKKSGECHYRKLQPTADTKRKRKTTKINTRKANKNDEKHIDQLSKRGLLG